MARQSPQGCLLDKCWSPKSRSRRKGSSCEQGLEPCVGRRKPTSFFVPSGLAGAGILQKLRPCVMLLNMYTPGPGCRETEGRFGGMDGNGRPSAVSSQRSDSTDRQRVFATVQTGGCYYASFQLSRENIPWSLS